jgi:hypothetical protein
LGLPSRWADLHRAFVESTEVKQIQRITSRFGLAGERVESFDRLVKTQAVGNAHEKQTELADAGQAVDAVKVMPGKDTFGSGRPRRARSE